MKNHNNAAPKGAAISTRTAAMNALANLGLLVILVAIALPLLHVGVATAKWVYLAGAVLTITGRLFAANDDRGNLRVRRLYRLETWSAVFFAVGVFFLFYSGSGRDWIAFTLAGAFLQGYTSLMIPKAFEKGAREAEKSKKS